MFSESLEEFGTSSLEKPSPVLAVYDVGNLEEKHIRFMFFNRPSDLHSLKPDLSVLKICNAAKTNQKG